jgi:raffinose/stachyose/melibiose transport system permease protein
MNIVKINTKNIAYTWPAFLMIIPTFVLLVIFSYMPAFDAVRHSLYVWDGDFVDEFVGLENFRRLFGDLKIWGSAILGGLLAFSACITDSQKWKKILRVASVVSYSLMAFAIFADFRSNPGAVTGKGGALFTTLLFLAFSICTGSLCFVKSLGKIRKLLTFFTFFFPIASCAVYMILARRSGDWLFWMGFNLVFILVLASLFQMWPSIFTAVCIHRLKSEKSQYFYRVLFVIPMIIPSMVMLLIWKFFYDPNVGMLNKILVWSGMDKVLIWMDSSFLHWGVFTEPFRPVWLGQQELIIPALIFWGFPWVGVVGVLIYLSGLQNISDSVYEAAEIDGISSWGKFIYIELPLIMTQIRLNLIMMIIGTFQAYGLQLILLGPGGGPGNKGLTTGLYMFYSAFLQQKYGYACAIGLVLFFIILLFTIANQKFVRSKAAS